MSRPRPWLYALSGAVASAAVIGVIAFTTHALSGPDADTGGLGTDQAPTSPPITTATASDSAAPASTPTTATTATAAGTKAYAVYYVGADAAGKPVLYREFHRGPDLPTAAPAGDGQDMLTEAVNDALATLPLDPDYSTPWHDLATLGSAYYTSTGAGYTLGIDAEGSQPGEEAGGDDAPPRHGLRSSSWCTRPRRRSASESPSASCSATSARPRRSSASPMPAERVTAAPALQTLSLVNISSPNEGDKVSGQLDGERRQQRLRGQLGGLPRAEREAATSPPTRPAARVVIASTPGPSPST